MTYTTLPKTEIERLLDQNEELAKTLDTKLKNYYDDSRSKGIYRLNKDQQDELTKLIDNGRVSFVNLNLKGYVFSMRDLSGLKFKQCDLTDAKFDKCTFSRNTVFENCVLKNTEFNNCKNLNQAEASTDNKFYIDTQIFRNNRKQWQKVIDQSKVKSAKPTDPVCKDWGTVNGWDKKTEDKFEKAKKKHEQMMKANPSAHDYHEQRIGRGYSEYKCKCGFRWGVDYSD